MSKKKMTKLTVRYVNPQHDIDVDLDNEIEKFFKTLGFRWWASGIDLVKPFERDIAFEKEQKR